MSLFAQILHISPVIVRSDWLFEHHMIHHSLWSLEGRQARATITYNYVPSVTLCTDAAACFLWPWPCYILAFAAHTKHIMSMELTFHQHNAHTGLGIFKTAANIAYKKWSSIIGMTNVWFPVVNSFRAVVWELETYFDCRLIQSHCREHSMIKMKLW